MILRPLAIQTIRPFGVRYKVTAEEAINSLVKRLENEQIPEPSTSAKWLVSAALGQKVQLAQDQLQQELAEDQQNQLETWSQCRLARMPIQYILKEWSFRNLELKMRPPVFIPRPETEELVELVIPHLKDGQNVMEMGCGSGAISLSLLDANSKLKITAVDQSKAACALTLENAIGLNLEEENFSVLNAKLTEQGKLERNGEEFQVDASFDLIISNPPYVLRKDLMNLDPEIQLFEDLRALDGGKDGLAVIRSILKLCKDFLKPEGILFLEVDPCHPHIIGPDLEKTGFQCKIVDKDFRDKDRFMMIQKY